MKQYIVDAFTDKVFGGNPAMVKLEGRGLILTATSKDYDFVSRCFYPKLDVPEDPVTGNAVLFMLGEIPFDQ